MSSLPEIWLDLTPAVRQPHSGIGLTVARSFEALTRIAPPGLLHPIARRAADQGASRANPLRLLFGKTNTIYHSFEHRLPHALRSRRLLSIHDLWTLRRGNSWQPERFQRRQAPLLDKAIRRADWITTPSLHVLDELHSLYPETRSRSSCVPWGPPHERLDGTGARAPRGIHGRPYFLTVASLEPRKNLEVIGRAVEGMDGFDWVIVGASGYRSEDCRRSLEESALRSKVRIHFKQGVSSEELQRLYADALALVLPSHEEGFGLPALEGACFGMPLLLSHIGPFHEIAGDSALYFDPRHADSLRAAVEGFLASPEKASLLGSGALARSREFSWVRTARGFLDLYSKIS